MSTMLGVVHGTTIELKTNPDLPDGQLVTVTLQRIGQPAARPALTEIPKAELWMNRLIFDPTVDSGERVVEGTRLAAEVLVAELQQNCSDEDLLEAHPELSREDVAALHHYARTPAGLRRSFGAWAEDAGEVDQFLAEIRALRKVPRRRDAE